jgi:hypothetical protein
MLRALRGAVAVRAARLFTRSLASGPHGSHAPKTVVAMPDTRAPRTEPLVEMGAYYPPGQLSPMECIESIPVIPVEGHLAMCDGGGGALGHPNEVCAGDNLLPLRTRPARPL